MPKKQPPFRVYFTVNALDDELLKSVVNREHLKKSSDYIETLAQSFGLQASQIVFPTPYKVRILAEAVAYAEAAKKRSLQNATGNTEGADSFELKRRVYQAEVERLLREIRADDFLGQQAAQPRQYPHSFSLARN